MTLLVTAVFAIPYEPHEGYRLAGSLASLILLSQISLFPDKFFILTSQEYKRKHFGKIACLLFVMFSYSSGQKRTTLKGSLQAQVPFLIL